MAFYWGNHTSNELLHNSVFEQLGHIGLDIQLDIISLVISIIFNLVSEWYKVFTLFSPAYRLFFSQIKDEYERIIIICKYQRY